MKVVVFLVICFVAYVVGSDISTLSRIEDDVIPLTKNGLNIPYDDPILDAVFGGTISTICNVSEEESGAWGTKTITT